MKKRIQANNESRLVSIRPAINPYAEGSVEVSFGNTKVHITASISEDPPKWLRNSDGIFDRGWISAEYGMLPRATHTRNKREAANGKQGGRTLEIQRLIGRAMRAAVNDQDIAGLLITLDCDVLVADGGTRTAAITGAWVALCHAFETLIKKKDLKQTLLLNQIAAISAGAVNNELLVDLCYEEDSLAEFDCNFVINSSGEIIEIQGTAEKRSLSFNEIQALYEMSMPNIKRIMAIQHEAVKDLEFIRVR